MDERFERDILKIKLIILGDPYVGKSSLMERFGKGKFYAQTAATIGIECVEKILSLGENMEAQVKIWDTAGQEKYHSLSFQFYKKSHGVLLVFDITQRSSFERVSYWADQIESHSQNDTIVYLLGNKTDLIAERAVKSDEASAMAQKYQMKYFETSAKEDINVKSTIESLIRDTCEPLMTAAQKKEMKNNTKKENNNAFRLSTQQHDTPPENNKKICCT